MGKQIKFPSLENQTNRIPLKDLEAAKKSFETTIAATKSVLDAEFNKEHLLKEKRIVTNHEIKRNIKKLDEYIRQCKILPISFVFKDTKKLLSSQDLKYLKLEQQALRIHKKAKKILKEQLKKKPKNSENPKNSEKPKNIEKPKNPVEISGKTKTKVKINNNDDLKIKEDKEIKKALANSAKNFIYCNNLLEANDEIFLTLNDRKKFHNPKTPSTEKKLTITPKVLKELVAKMKYKEFFVYERTNSPIRNLNEVNQNLDYPIDIDAVISLSNKFIEEGLRGKNTPTAILNYREGENAKEQMSGFFREYDIPQSLMESPTVEDGESEDEM